MEAKKDILKKVEFIATTHGYSVDSKENRLFIRKLGDKNRYEIRISDRVVSAVNFSGEFEKRDKNLVGELYKI